MLVAAILVEQAVVAAVDMVEMVAMAAIMAVVEAAVTERLVVLVA